MKNAKKHDSKLTKYLERIAAEEELSKGDHETASKTATELDEYKKDITHKIKATEALAKRAAWDVDHIWLNKALMISAVGLGKPQADPMCQRCQNR